MTELCASSVVIEVSVALIASRLYTKLLQNADVSFVRIIWDLVILAKAIILKK